MKKILYLDYNCFQRSFDDHSQARIRMEAAACEAIFALAYEKKIHLVWSFMHEDENEACPFEDRKIEALNLARLCTEYVGPTEKIRRLAHTLQKEYGIKDKDALHVACAKFSGASSFVTCDDALKRKAGKALDQMLVIYPNDLFIDKV